MDFDKIWPEMGRYGSVRAETLGKWSWELQEGFGIPPGPPGCHKKYKNGRQSPKIPKTQELPYLLICLLIPIIPGSAAWAQPISINY